MALSQALAGGGFRELTNQKGESKMKDDKNIKSCLLGFILMSLCGQALASESSSKLDKAMNAQMKVADQSVQSQKKVTVSSVKAKDLYEEFKATQKQIENTKIYNEQMKKLISSQREEVTSMKQQISELKQTNKEILPLMEKMTSTLGQFVSLDSPFLRAEREARVSELKSILSRANISTSEKFRRILEAYQIENEYGRTIEAYRGKMAISGKDTTVDFLRLGRVGFYYQTLDREKTYAWSVAKGKWIEVGSGEASSILQGIKMAQKQVTPNLVQLPIEKSEVKL